MMYRAIRPRGPKQYPAKGGAALSFAGQVDHTLRLRMRQGMGCLWRQLPFSLFLYLELSSQVQQRIEENLKRGLPAEAFARSTVEFGNEGCYLSLAEVLHINRLGTVFTD